MIKKPKYTLGVFISYSFRYEKSVLTKYYSCNAFVFK